MEGLLSTGVGGLDEILLGGLPERTVTLLQGEAGAGKTTAALHFLAAGATEGKTCLLLSVAQTVEEVTTIADSHNIAVDGIDMRCLELRKGDLGAPYTVDTNEADLHALLEETYGILDEVEPDLFVFDSLLELRLLSPDDIRYRQEVLKLKRAVVARGISALMLDHATSLLADVHVEGVVHGVISLESVTPQIGATHRRLRIKKFRAHAYVQGYHDFEIKSGGLEVYPRVVPLDLPPMELGPPLQSGREDLDSMLGGGVEFASTTLIAGQSGTGKSTLSTVFATAAAEQGIKAGMFLFEERPEVYRDRSAGVGLDVSTHENAKRLFFHHFDPAEITPGEFSQFVLRRVEEDALGMVVIDSLSGYLNSVPYTENIVTQLHALMQYLARRGIVVIVVMAQHGLLDEGARTDIDVSFIADSVILVRHVPTSNEIQRVIGVLKKRHTAHQRRFRNFIIEPGRVAFEDIPDHSGELLTRRPNREND